MTTGVTVRVRRRARMIALQALYEIDLTNHPIKVVIPQRLADAEEPVPPSAVPFIYHLVEGVMQHRALLDEQIQAFAPEWPIEQMSPIDRNILRMALFEFRIDGSTPVKVAINEAVELAKLFGGESAPRFVNGVLGSLSAQPLTFKKPPLTKNTS